jgi:hypothetical protein
MASPTGVGIRDRLRFPREEVMEGLRDVVRHPHEFVVHGEQINAQCYEALCIFGHVAQAEREHRRNVPGQDLWGERVSSGKLASLKGPTLGLEGGVNRPCSIFS